MDKTGLYIHVPFCADLCDYCSFYSRRVSAFQSDILDIYIGRLCDEIGAAAHEDLWVDSVYVGGGTPTLLSPHHMERIMNTLNRAFQISVDAEITIETNPRHVSASLLKQLKRLGYTRISLGIQTFNRELFTFLGRKGGYAEKEILDQFFSADLDHSVDFITGIRPGQDSLKDLKLIAPYRPEHISVYLLSVDQGTVLNDRYTLPDAFDLQQRESYINVSHYLCSSGYEHYEISNFALPGFRGVHNSKYWAYLPYLGFGPGAHSFDGTRRFYNSGTIEEYCRGEKREIEDSRNRGDMIVEFFMTGLRRKEGVFEKDFLNIFAVPFPDDIVSRSMAMDQVTLSGMVPERSIAIDQESWITIDSTVYALLEPYVK